MKDIRDGFLGGADNIMTLLGDFTENVADYQAKHKISFRETMAVIETYLDAMRLADKHFAYIYAKTLASHGINSDGEQVE